MLRTTGGHSLPTGKAERREGNHGRPHVEIHKGLIHCYKVRQGGERGTTGEHMLRPTGGYSLLTGEVERREGNHGRPHVEIHKGLIHCYKVRQGGERGTTGEHMLRPTGGYSLLTGEVERREGNHGRPHVETHMGIIHC